MADQKYFLYRVADGQALTEMTVADGADWEAGDLDTTFQDKVAVNDAWAVEDYYVNIAVSPVVASLITAHGCSIDQTTIDAKPGAPATTEATISSIANPSNYVVTDDADESVVDSGTVTDGTLVFSSTVDGAFTITISAVPHFDKAFNVTVNP
jgi:hypothetical protein